jgi:hypothetical protein
MLTYLQNILLTLDNPPNIKVADFGLAKCVNSQTMLRVNSYLFFHAALTIDPDHVWHAELSGARSRITGTQWTRIRSQGR